MPRVSTFQLIMKWPFTLIHLGYDYSYYYTFIKIFANGMFHFEMRIIFGYFALKAFSVLYYHIYIILLDLHYTSNILKIY